MSDINFADLELNEEELPQVEDSELVFGAKLPPLPEGTYAVKSTLGKNGVKYDKAKQSFTVHVENKIIKPLKVIDPNVGDNVLFDGSELTERGHKVFFTEDGTGKGIHDFFRLSVSNLMGIQKAVQFLKYAGDPEYKNYRKPSQLAQALEEALKAEPDHMKLVGRWSASVVVGKDDNGKDKYEAVRGVKKFPRKNDGGISHVVEIDGEQVAAQLEVTEYGEVTEKDAR